MGAHRQDRAPRRSRAGRRLSRLIEARGRCPPEDVGGPWGYGELLEAIAHLKHERFAEF
ncbi:MAG TPA: hypothetical protein VFY53_12355 [Rhodoplanes sp.]|nr:hypothetical protein [Rhodoplanes sp.]